MLTIKMLCELRKTMKKSLLIILLALSNFTFSTDLDVLKKQHYDFIATPEGKKYEMVSIGTFWGDAKFMQICAPADAPVPEPFDIFYIVQSDGTVKGVFLSPETKVGLCIKEHVLERVFSNPPSEFVGYIKMSFTQ